MHEAREKVRSFILGNFYVADPTSLADSASLLDSGIVDSTGVLEVITFIEDEFKLKVDYEEMLPANLDSIDAITAFVARKLG